MSGEIHARFGRWVRLARHSWQAPNPRLFSGVYRDFAEAYRNAPRSRRAGYNQPEAPAFFLPRVEQVSISDYPIFFYLAPLLKQGVSVFDLGGSVGISYYAYKPYLTYPPGLKWLVCEIPEMVSAGEKLLSERDRPGLAYTVDTKEAARSDVVLASGSLQYIETPLSALLSHSGKRPGHLLINRTPLTERKAFVTLQDLGPMVCAYQILNRGQLIESLAALGYELRDGWQCHEHACEIRYHPEQAVHPYSGLYFRLKE